MLTFEKVAIDDVAVFIPEVSFNSIQDVTVRPNPVHSHVHIDFVAPLESDATLNIHNSQGQLVYSSRLAQGTNTESFDIRHLAPGIYTLICMNDKALVTHPYRIVKI
jgi:hypothetical protein